MKLENFEVVQELKKRLDEIYVFRDALLPATGGIEDPSSVFIGDNVYLLTESMRQEVTTTINTKLLEEAVQIIDKLNGLGVEARLTMPAFVSVLCNGLNIKEPIDGEKTDDTPKLPALDEAICNLVAGIFGQKPEEVVIHEIKVSGEDGVDVGKVLADIRSKLKAA